MIPKRIIIPGSTMSKKNSKTPKWRGKRLIPMSSDDYIEWEENLVLYLKLKCNPYDGAYPVELFITFYRLNKKIFDFDNMVTTIQDVLVKAGIIKKDDMNHLISIPNYKWYIDKDNPRAEVIIRDCQNYE